MSRLSSRVVAPDRPAGPHLAAAWDDLFIVAVDAGTRDASAARGCLAGFALLGGFEQLTAQASLGTLPAPADRAIVVGTQSGAVHDVVQFLSDVERLGAHLANGGLFPMTVMNAAAGLAAIRYGCEGPNITLHGGPSAGFDAVALGADLIASGRAQLAFVGGFETVERDGRLVAVHALLALTTLDRLRAGGGQPLARLLGSRSTVARTTDDAAEVLLALGGAIHAVSRPPHDPAAVVAVTHPASATSLLVGPAPHV